MVLRTIRNKNVSPQERAEWEFKTKVGVAEALAKSSYPLVPTIMVNSDKSGSGSSALDAVGLKYLMDIADKVNKK